MKNDAVFQKMILLDRLEELREDLEELGISTLDELNERIAALEQEIGDLGDAEDDDGPV
jgi:uncharacterized small protein (DUF1192 family)